jgi:hypothetical protein
MRLDWTDFAWALPQEERLIFQYLRNLILETEPRLQEKMNYGVPYFVRNRMVCFIWPVSAPNAPTAKNQTLNDTIVSLGFCHGNKLSNEQVILLSEGRKQVYIVRLRSMDELRMLEKPITEILQEAILLDEMLTGLGESNRTKVGKKSQ